MDKFRHSEAQSTKQFKRLNWSSQRLAWVLMFILMGSILLLISLRISYVSAVAFTARTSLAIQALLQLLDLSKNKLGDLDSPAGAHITVGGRMQPRCIPLHAHYTRQGCAASEICCSRPALFYSYEAKHSQHKLC